MAHKDNIVKYVHNSKDDKIYQLAHDIEQKIKDGIIMPDYELNQKHFHHHGEICLNYLKPLNALWHVPGAQISENHWFEGTYNITEVGTEKDMYETHISVNSQTVCCVKNDSNNKEGQLVSNGACVKLEINWEEVPELLYYDTNGGEWIQLYDYNSRKINYTSNNSTYIISPIKHDGWFNKLLIRVYALSEYNTVKLRSTNRFIKKDSDKIIGYNGLKFTGPDTTLLTTKGIFLSKKKNWLYIKNKNIDSISVLHGGMKYSGGNETIWRIQKENTPWKILYRGYGKNRFGGSKTKVNQGEMSSVIHNKRSKWRKCKWLSLWSDDVKKTIYIDFNGGIVEGYRKIIRNRLGKYKANDFVNHKPQRSYVSLVIPRNNRYELWRLWLNYEGKNQRDWVTNFSFQRYLSLDEGFNLHKLKKDVEMA